MRRVWLIRAGDTVDDFDAMRSAGQIGVRFESVGNARELTAEEIEQTLIDRGHGTAAPAQRVILMHFAHDVHVGDLVVCPTARREIWVGIVADGYDYNEDPAVHGYQHTRRVDWLGWLERDAPWMRDQLKSIDRPPTMYELPGRAWWLHQVDSREFATRPRPAWSKPAARTTRSTRSAKAPSAPRKAPAALVRCGGTCGFLWAPTSLVDGLCADCRGD